VLAANDLGKHIERRVHRQHVSDTSIDAFHRHVDGDDRLVCRGTLKQVRYLGFAGGKYLLD
jgi:hypothetical protein